MNITSNIGMLLLAAGLIIYGIGMFVAVAIPPVLVGLWAIITGVLILVGR